MSLKDKIARYAGCHLLILVLTGALAAQDRMPSEQVLLTTDRKIYITGEQIYFKAFMMYGDLPDQLSDILYLELVDQEHAPVVQEKYIIREAECNGSLTLPAGISTGNYYLRAYTNWMKNEGPESFARQLLSVINPFTEIDPHLLSREGETKSSPLVQTADDEIGTSNSKQLIRVNGLKEEYLARERVELDIRLQGPDGQAAAGNFALSVVRKGLERKVAFAESKAVLKNASSMEYVFPPEWGGHFISGRIQPQNGGASFGGDTLFCSLVDRQAMLKYCITDSLGNFGFLLDMSEGSREVVIQNYNAGKSGYNIILDNPFSEMYTSERPPPFRFDTARLDLLNSSIIAAQVQALYQDEKEIEVSPEGQSFYGTPEHQVALANYVKLPEMWEVFFELIPAARMRVSDEEVIVRMIDSRKGSFPDRPPMLLVDGVLTPDPRDAAELDPQQVKRIELVNMEYCLGALKFPGIINILTYEGLCPVEYPQHFFRQVYDFLTPEFPVKFPEHEKSTTDPRPDLRNTLYWDPEVKTDASGRVSVQFFTADESADYTVLVAGLTSTGEKVNFSGTITVRQGLK